SLTASLRLYAATLRRAGRLGVRGKGNRQEDPVPGGRPLESVRTSTSFPLSTRTRRRAPAGGGGTTGDRSVRESNRPNPTTLSTAETAGGPGRQGASDPG